MKRVIITGADGFVGSYTVKYFLEHNVEVLAVDIGEVSKRLKPRYGLTYLSCDITDLATFEALIPKNTYDTFIHFAWAGSSGIERTNYQLQLNNASTTVECMKMAKRIGCHRFVVAGSIMEYEVEATIHIQNNRPGLGYIYGMGKYIAHCLCKAIADNIGIDLIWPMITNAYGVGEYSPRFVNTTLRKIISGEPLHFTAATQNYDFVYVTDVAKAFYLIADKGHPFCEYMIGSGHARPLKEFIQEMLKSCAPHRIPIFGDIPFTGTNMSLDVFSITALQKDCGYVPEVEFSRGTQKTLEWLKTL